MILLRALLYVLGRVVKWWIVTMLVLYTLAAALGLVMLLLGRTIPLPHLREAFTVQWLALYFVLGCALTVLVGKGPRWSLRLIRRVWATRGTT